MATNENFVENKPARAAEKGHLPYMEMKTSFGQTTDDIDVLGETRLQAKPNKEEGYGLSLQLGAQYERKKQQLKEELRRDYRCYVAEKLDTSAGEPGFQQQAPSRSRRQRTTIQPRAPFQETVVSTTPYHPSFSTKSQQQKIPDRPPSSRRDVGTVTDPLPWMAPTPVQRHWEETPEYWRLRARRYREHYSSEDELNTEEEEQEELEKRKSRHRAEPAHTSRRERRLQHRTYRATQERREMEAPSSNADFYQEENRQTALAVLKANAPASVQAKPVNKNVADFATGLIIGATEREEETQWRKERYRRELLEQISEQKRNKRKEKELELRVAATGAVDPEKQSMTVCLPDLPQPDRIKQFGAVKREHEGRWRDVPYRPGLGLGTLRADSDKRTQMEEREPPERPRVAFQSPILEYSAALGHLGNTSSTVVASLSEDFHKGLSGSLGEMVASRVTGIPPPPAPTLSESYTTPYDDAYYFYGARNPLDPNLTHYGTPVGAVQTLVNLPEGKRTSFLKPPDGVLAQMGPGASSERHRQKENVSSYKEALKQQIEERKERKRREKEEQERSDAKVDAEMKAYEPWGRGGAGAPLRDDEGNLISDLKHMHRSNEEAYMNPESRNKRRFMASTHRAGATSRAENKEPSIVSGLNSSFTQPSPHARGKVFSERPSPQQIHEQEKYKESLKQQIEEKQKMEAEKRERLRLEEEREEKRLAEERACMLRQYEEEQEKERRKEMEQDAKNQEMIRLIEERQREVEKKRNEEELKQSEALRQQYERERQARLEQDHRSSSPPIPTVQKRLGHQNPPRPPTVESQHSPAALSAQSVSTPRSPPVPARRNQIRAAEEQQGVISELSILRRHLKSEQRRLEGQLLESNREDVQSPFRNRQRPLLDVFDMARLRLQAPARKLPSNTRPVNMQNMQDLNQPKFRDYFDLSSPIKAADQRRESCTDEPERRSLLQSESAFIDPNGYSVLPMPQPERISARERRRQAKRPDFDDGVETPGRERFRQFLGSASSFHLNRVQEQNQCRMKALNALSEHDWRAGEISTDDEDLWQQSPSPFPARRISTTTVATEPWLRPGTTETLKKLMAGRRPPSHNEWPGPSTYHG